MGRGLLVIAVLAGMVAVAGWHVSTASADTIVALPTMTASPTTVNVGDTVTFDTDGTECYDITTDADFFKPGSLSFGDGTGAPGGSAVGHSYSFPGTYDAKVSVSCPSSSGSFTVPITVTAPNTSATAPASLDIGNVVIGLTGTGEAIITNTGGSPLYVLHGGISATGGFVADTSCEGQTIAPSSSCAVTVSYSPSGRGLATGTLSVGANVSGGEITVPLSATGLDVESAASPAALDFAAEYAGQATAYQAATLTNVGLDPVKVSSVLKTGSPAFKMKGQLKCTTTPIAPGGSCTVFVLFQPGAQGSFSGAIVFQTNGLSNPSVPLSGTGLASADVAVSVGAPGSVTSGDQMTYSLTVRGNGPSPAQNVVMSDQLPASVRIISITLPSSGRCDIPGPGQTGAITCTWNQLGKGAVRTLLVTVQVNTGSGQTLSDGLSAGSTTYDPHPLNNTASVDTAVT